MATDDVPYYTLDHRIHGHNWQFVDVQFSFLDEGFYDDLCGDSFHKIVEYMFKFIEEIQCLFGVSLIIYENTKSGFSQDVLNGVIDEKIRESFSEKMGHSVSYGERRSWRNSLVFIDMILRDEGIPNDIGVALEYSIPYTSKRVDVILSGYNETGNNTAIIVELKQWDVVESIEEKDGIVKTILNGGLRETTHPSYQAWSYANTICNFNEEVQIRPIILAPCAYLHNYNIQDENDPLLDPIYCHYIELAPIFSKKDAIKFQNFIKEHLRHGDNKETIFFMEDGRIRPSKSLQDALVGMLEGNDEFIMIDEQKVAYEEILRRSMRAENNEKKYVTIVKGGPGTGKSVIAVNLLVRLIEKGLNAKYITKNAAPRGVYSEKLKGKKRKVEIDNLFGGTGSFYTAEKNTFDVLITDEAHRLNEKSGLYQKGENQIKEIINASRHAVFFIDEKQRVTAKDIGSIKEIRKYAELLGANVVELELNSQFRCNGSDGYVEWLDHVLQIEGAKEPKLSGKIDYEIEIVKDPQELRKIIEEKNTICNKSRMVAGYCWDWIAEGKNRPDIFDVRIDEFGFGMSWNLSSTETWAIDSDSISEIGCIHTCQGLEFDYVGVIIGDDLRYEDNKVITDRRKRAKTDKSLHGLGSKYKDGDLEKEADAIIRNTYRTLLTRGQKGCYVYCTDKNLERYLLEAKSRINDVKYNEKENIDP